MVIWQITCASLQASCSGKLNTSYGQNVKQEAIPLPSSIQTNQNAGVFRPKMNYAHIHRAHNRTSYYVHIILKKSSSCRLRAHLNGYLLFWLFSARLTNKPSCPVLSCPALSCCRSRSCSLFSVFSLRRVLHIVLNFFTDAGSEVPFSISPEALPIKQEVLKFKLK